LLRAAGAAEASACCVADNVAKLAGKEGCGCDRA